MSIVREFLSKGFWYRPCIFCEIANDHSSEKILYQDSDIVAFYDIKPSAKTHILIIPKEHIESVKTIHESDYDLLLKMRAKAHDLLGERGHDPQTSRLGFHVPPFNTVYHLHLHVLGGDFKSAKKRLKYEEGKKWFMDLEQLIAKLQSYNP
ncbi:hypothetical protein BGX26_009532 [Mortierella sp. AD094]|nr:hypothetical protein BGX26_009532 [Mortierella sp. AD094]